MSGHGTVLYVSLHEASGYGVAARRAMLALAEAGADVHWQPLVPGTAWGPDLFYGPSPPGTIADAELQPFLGEPASPDTVVAHLVPEYYPRVRAEHPGATLVGHTVWETDRLPGHWPDLLEIPDLLVVPCTWNADTIRQAGVSTPVRVVPHVAATPARSSSTAWDDLPDRSTVFYTIGTWTVRKAMWNTVLAFQRAFSAADPVHLVVKTTEADLTSGHGAVAPGAPGSTTFAIAGLLADVPSPAAMSVVTRELDDEDVRALHQRGDCFVSLCRSEGWGLPAFDAATAATPVVITGYGGHLDYLDRETAFLVDYELVAVDDPQARQSYSPDQSWAEPSVEHGATLLHEVLDDPAGAQERARRAAARIRDRYAPDVLGARWREVLDDAASLRPRRRWFRR